LILPRVIPPLTTSGTSSLKTLLSWDKEKAKNCLLDLQNESKKLISTIEEEMIEKYGFKWDIWAGFHAVPSMEHLHLHVISSDLCSPSLKNKKHYNSFHPKLGFFLHLHDVLEWFDATSSHYTTVSKLDKAKYELILKESLVCWRCEAVQRNIPTLKTHLQNHFDDDVKRAQRKPLKRKRDEDSADDTIITAKKSNVATESGDTRMDAD